ncbi:MAG: carbamoyltransferase HypF [Actinomycetota bacterium]|nr:carbamoyltransferase HypF [Actinomycetota bacterium]
MQPGSRRVRVRVTGTVQGVGFRPFVYRLAGDLGLAGYVLNDDRGVLLEAEGTSAAVDSFLARLPADAPPLATVEQVCPEELAPTGAPGFEIVASRRGGTPLALVSPDVATCAACLSEIADPADRRYRYPFTNCTDCGPRFTIVIDVPYDRALTTMSGFEMCPLCAAEYEDPSDRRFHAQPNACPQCGPMLRLLEPRGEPVGAEDPLAAAARALREGAVVAIKGLGGYHLACRADHEEATAALRSRKHREDKPFALMAANLAAAQELVELTRAEEGLLLSRERPIVIARRRSDAPVAGAVAPRAPDLGVMLPYTPLHHLLLAEAGVTLVMTSGNLSDEPIAYEDAEAGERLRPIADLLLTHDRPIHVRADDSVVRSLGEIRPSPLMLRRSRGYAPASIPLPVASPRAVLACGAELKSAFCLAQGPRAWLSHHIGDLKNYETLRSFEQGVAHFERLFAVSPEVVAHDLHPDYLSTRYALAREGVETIGVQHHHAHLAACLAEHGEQGPAVGAIYDGTGYGEDGTVWGGELLFGGLASYQRAGSLATVPMPGGERAVSEPWRMACSWLVAAGQDQPSLPAALADTVSPERWEQVAALARRGFASPATSSMGRLFDAVSSLCGIRATVTYEGQAAIELEAAAGAAPEGDPYPLPLRDPEGTVELDATETVRAVARDVAGGASIALVSARFHAAVATATADACARIAERRDTDLVVLSGGVFNNRLLVERTVALLEDRRLRVLLPELLPAGDGGISYGQAAAAAARLSRSHSPG